MGFMASPVGNALGVAVAPLLVAQQDAGDDVNSSEGKVEGMTAFMVGQLVLAGAATLWAWWALQDRPPTPPSHAAAQEIYRSNEERAARQGHQQRQRGQQEGWREAVAAGWAPVRACWASWRDFRVLLWCFGLGCVRCKGGRGGKGSGRIKHCCSVPPRHVLIRFLSPNTHANANRCGFFNALMTTLGQLLAPCGYGSNAAGIMGGLLLLFGLLGAIAAGLLLDRTHCYAPLLRLAFGGTALAVLVVLGLLHSAEQHRPLALAVAFGVLGLVMLPLLPITMESAAEATYPIPELVSSGLLLTAANLLGIPLVLLLSWLLDRDTCTHFLRPPVVVIIVVVAAAALPLVFYKGETKRLEAEAEARVGAEEAATIERDGSRF